MNKRHSICFVAFFSVNVFGSDFKVVYAHSSDQHSYKVNSSMHEQTNTAHQECGTDGVTIDQRIQDCSRLPESLKKTRSGVIWRLVSRKRDPDSRRIMEVWKDTKSGTVWGDALSSTYTHYDAEAACSSEEGKAASAHISEILFSLPSMGVYEIADENGLREVLPNMTERDLDSDYIFFWTSTIFSPYPKEAYSFWSREVVGNFPILTRNDNCLVRCVGL